MKVWSWRQAVQKSDLPSTTKLVLFNLSIYMNEAGQGCFPSTKQQSIDTGLSERSVITHLHNACEAGFLEKSTMGVNGQGWSRNKYEPGIPKGTEIVSARYNHKGTEGDSVRNKKGTEPLSKGTEPDDKKALNDVQSNTPINTPYNTPIEGCSIQQNLEPDKKNLKDDFEEDVWGLWIPIKTTKGSKQMAFERYKAAISKGESRDEIRNGCRDYIQYCHSTNQYTQQVERWIKKRRWKEDWTIPANIGDKKPGYSQPHQNLISGFMQADTGHDQAE